ncbi:helix-turn-helix domain-containing protein, partial [bacterium]|nr:helix-turn-helix domain-containing protein [bacterium]
GIDGYTVCHRLKADPRTATIPVIFLSANTTVAHKLEGFAAGGVDYIGKPFWAEEVVARVFVHLQIKQQVERLQAIAAGEPPSALNKFAHPVVDIIDITKQANPVSTDSRDNEIVVAAVAQLQHDPAEWPGLDSLAKRVGTHEKKLTKLFRQHFGMTVFDYVAELRLENARAQLAS